MPQSFAPVEIDEAALALALDIPTGIEYEFLGQPRPDRATGLFSPGERVPENYGRTIGTPEGWEPGWDCGNCEIRSVRPTPLGQQAENLARLREYMAAWPHPVREGAHRSFHVHINTDPRHGPAVNYRALRRAFLEMRDEAESLCANIERRDYIPYIERGVNRYEAGVDPLEFEGRTPDHSCELSEATGHGTSELRLWDATMDPELHGARVDFLHRMIARAITIESREAVNA